MTLFSYIKSKLSILEVVLEYVKLKQAGNYWKGPCPFHAEKDASFTISPDKHIFYCFGCHSGGDVVSFIAKAENLSPIEAATHLSDRYNIAIPKEIQDSKGAASISNQKGFYHLCDEVANWCKEQLKFNHKASSYVSNRGIDEATTKYFDIGYFPGGMTNINKFTKYMASKNVLLKDLIDAGIIIKGNRVNYSPFEERIMFPIRDILGRTCGFGGRVFAPNDERAKYYNSKESDHFHKGKILFGLNLAKKHMRESEHAFLVEGYTDCVAMAQHGYKNVVATLGTACTAEHLKILSRYVNTIYVLYDGDAAGQKAILRLVELCWGASLELKIVRLPSSDDPATFFDRGGNLDELIHSSEDIFSFFVEKEGALFAKKTLPEKLKLSKKVMDVISRLDDPFKQDLLLQKASNIMQIPYDTLKESMKASDKAKAEDATTEVDEGEADNETLEKKILFAIINNLSEYEDFSIDNDLMQYFSPKAKSLLERLDAIASKEEAANRFGAFFESLDEGKKGWVSSNCLKFGGDIRPSQFRNLLFQFRKERWREFVADIKLKMLRAQKASDGEALKNLTKRFMELKKEMKSRGLV